MNKNIRGGYYLVYKFSFSIQDYYWKKMGINYIIRCKFVI